MDQKEYKIVIGTYKKEKVNSYGVRYNATYYTLKCNCCGRVTDNMHFDYIYRKCKICRSVSLVDTKCESGSVIIKEYKDSSKKYHSKMLGIKCHCGKEYSISLLSYTRSKLKSTPVQCKSCHCKSTAKKFAKKDTDSEIERFMKSYIMSAQSRGILFDLTFEEFKHLCLKECYYCGVEFTDYVHRIKHNETKKNGIDRKDNTEGYIKSNVVSCCGTCNRIKQTLNHIEFLNQVSKIHNYQIKNNEL